MQDISEHRTYSLPLMYPEFVDKPPPAREQVSVKDGTVVTGFDEYTFRAPRVGLFVGDWTWPHVNPIKSFRFHVEEVRSSLSTLAGGAFLERLPREVLHQILGLLDPCSVVSFAGTSPACRGAVLSLQHFQAVAACPRLLGTVVHLRCRFFTFAALGSCVSDPRCRFCGQFGDMLYLVTAIRMCHPCWRKYNYDWTAVIVSKYDTQVEEDAAAAGIPHVRLPRGCFGSLPRGVLHEARRAFDRSALAKSFNYKLNVPGDRTTNEPFLMSYAVTVQLPYRCGEDNGAWEEGFLCRACAHQGWEFTTREAPPRFRFLGDPYPGWGLPTRRYTRAGMVAHVEQHGRIFRLAEANGSVR